MGMVHSPSLRTTTSKSTVFFFFPFNQHQWSLGLLFKKYSTFFTHNHHDGQPLFPWSEQLRLLIPPVMMSAEAPLLCQITVLVWMNYEKDLQTIETPQSFTVILCLLPDKRRYNPAVSWLRKSTYKQYFVNNHWRGEQGQNLEEEERKKKGKTKQKSKRRGRKWQI